MRSTWGRFQLLVATSVAAMALAIVPALGVATAGAAVRAIPVPRISWQHVRRERGRAGGRVRLRDGGARGLPGSVRAENQAGGRGARGHRAGPPGRDLLQPGRARRPRHGTAPGVDRVLAEGTAARVRHRELGPARVGRARRSSASRAPPRKARSSASTPIFPSAGPSRPATSAGGARSARSAPRGTARCSGTSRPPTRPAT